jgi:hypothetical protein
MPAKTQREREQAARKEKLALMREQVKEGSLVIRKMTAKERARYGSASSRPSGRKRRGS